MTEDTRVYVYMSDRICYLTRISSDSYISTFKRFNSVQCMCLHVRADCIQGDCETLQASLHFTGCVGSVAAVSIRTCLVSLPLLSPVSGNRFLDFVPEGGRAI